MDWQHDDITYQSIAKAFGLPVKLHDEAFERMKKLSKPHPSLPKFDWETPSAALSAKKRMVEIPFDESKNMWDQVVFVADDMWVPLAIVNGNVHILPGVPSCMNIFSGFGIVPRFNIRITSRFQS